MKLKEKIFQYQKFDTWAKYLPFWLLQNFPFKIIVHFSYSDLQHILILYSHTDYICSLDKYFTNCKHTSIFWKNFSSILNTYIQSVRIWVNTLALFMVAGGTPGGPGSARASCLLLNISTRPSTRWLDSNIASAERLSSVTRSTEIF